MGFEPRPLFQNVTIRGPRGAVIWKHQAFEAATLGAWMVQRRVDPQTGHRFAWTLRATVTQSDSYRIRQRELLFTAAKDHGHGFWCFPITSLAITGTRVVAELGAPEY